MAVKKKVSTHISYFDHLVFDKTLLSGWVAKYITNMRLVVLILLAILIGGLASYFNLPKRLNPEINLPIVTIATVLPGAPPKDVESLITIPLEKEISSIANLNDYTSVSRDNVSVLSLEFSSQTTPQDAEKEVKAAVDRVTLPDNALDPNVAALDFENQPVWEFALTTEADTATLHKTAKMLREELEKSNKLSRVLTPGLPETQIRIEIDPETSRDFGLSPLTLSQSIKSALNTYPAGLVETDTNSFSLAIDKSIFDVADLRLLPVTVNNQQLPLGTLAKVYEAPKNNEPNAYFTSPDSDVRDTVIFSIYKSKSSNIDAAVKDAQEIVNTTLDKTPVPFTTKTIVNYADEINNQFNELLGEFFATVLLVVGCLFLFLGLRQALISSLTVPLTYLSAFMIMQYIGMSINFLSLFAFLIALGLLVDDTIVVVSAMTAYYRTKKFTAVETGILVWRDTIVPIWSTTITTIWSFVPLLLSTGIIGEFIKPIPVVVTATMISSTAIAVGITLPFMIVLLSPKVPYRVIRFFKVMFAIISPVVLILLFRTNQLIMVAVLVYLLLMWIIFRHGKNLLKRGNQTLLANPRIKNAIATVQQYSSHGVISVEGFSQKYYRFILRLIKNPRARRLAVSAIVIYAVVGFMLVPFGLVKNEFFPKSDSDTLYVSLELPQGTNAEVATRYTGELIQDISTRDHVQYAIARTNTGLSNFGDSENSANSSLFTLHLTDEKERKEASWDIAQNIRDEFANFEFGEITVTEQSGGPPAGADVALTFVGNDLQELNTLADASVEYLKKEPGVINVKKSVSESTGLVVFKPNLNEIASQGATLDAIALWLRTYLSGFTLANASLVDSKDTKDFVYLMSDRPVKIADLMRLSIPVRNNQYVPLNSLGTFEIQPNPSLITRENGQRTIAVSGSVVGGFSISDKNKALGEFVTTLDFPDGYSTKTGGVNEENQKSVNSILLAMLVAFLLIMITMVIQFNSFRQAAIVLAVIPLAVSSVFYAFGLTGIPLSFPALIGVLALFGIVVTNSMFIVDKINLNLREKMPFAEAIADAGSSRMEPIILTKLGTILGLLPITLADPLWRGLGGAIISGILIASTIMLVFIPSLYYSVFNPKKE